MLRSVTVRARDLSCLGTLKLNAASLSADFKPRSYAGPEDRKQLMSELLDNEIPELSLRLSSLTARMLARDLPSVELNMGEAPFSRLSLTETLALVQKLSSNLDRQGEMEETRLFPYYKFHRNMFGLFGAAALLCDANRPEWAKLSQKVAPREEDPIFSLSSQTLPSLKEAFSVEASIATELEEVAKNCSLLSKALRVFCDPNAISTLGRGLQYGLQAIGFIVTFPSISPADGDRGLTDIRLNMCTQGSVFLEAHKAWPKLISLAGRPVSVKYEPGFLNQVSVVDNSSSN